MEFQYSEVVDPKEYITEGLCDGIPLRIHKDPSSEINGALRCQKDWSERVSPISNYKGTLGTPFSFIRVTIPESLPDRLEVVSYANEYAFIYDDIIMEDLEQSLHYEDRSRIMKQFSQKSNHEEFQTKSSEGNGTKQIQAQIFAEMLAIDEKRAKTTMYCWRKFIDVVSSRMRSEPFKSLEEYLPYRISDAGELFWFGLVTFAMSLEIPQEEIDLCKTLSRPSWEALALTNDLYSWRKERDHAKKTGQLEVVNAIWVLTQEHSISEAEAMRLCKDKIRGCVSLAVKIVEQNRYNTSYSVDLRRYLEAVLYSISGNLVWSIYCPRYHSHFP